jgi:UDP-GlcNAc:undecaprenyl-phosphate/decaprenyl-phosphate GlcNAc-1-phosphate transferase
MGLVSSENTLMYERVLISMAVVITSYALCTMLVFPVRALAKRLGIVDKTGGRKDHCKPVPLMGGLAIFVSLAAVIWTSLFFLRGIQSNPMAARVSQTLSALSNYVVIEPKLWALLAGSVIVTFIGLVDDIRGHFSPSVKLAGQIAAAALLIPAGINVDLLGSHHVAAFMVSVVWVVGITNSFNLLDNMNGLSSGIALICSVIFLVLVMFKGEFFIALLLSAMIGSTLGFFQFNMRNGSIFMGDAGSLLLGYLLGSLSLMARYADPDDAYLLPILAPVMILALPLFDTASVIVIRLRNGHPVFLGDQMHLSHRLVRMGMTQRQAVCFNYLMAFTFGVNALLMLKSRILHSMVALVQVAALAAMVSILMTARNRANSVSAASLSKSEPQAPSHDRDVAESRHRSGLISIDR